ncbi:MAG: hypothetical protein WC647_03035 [Desulfomonilaceae bacterium]
MVRVGKPGHLFCGVQLIHSQDRLDRVASLGVGDCFIDLAEVIKLHKAVKGKLPCSVQIDQFRNEALRNGIPLDYAEAFPSVCQRVCTTASG